MDEAAPLRTQIVEEAASHDGAAYRYGASGPDAFDCSGFTSYVFEQVGVDLPRTSQRTPPPSACPGRTRGPAT